MEELDLITGLAEIGEELKSGNANTEKLHAQVLELIKLLREQPAPQVTVQAMGAAPAHHKWAHSWVYDARDRLISGESIPVRIEP